MTSDNIIQFPVKNEDLKTEEVEVIVFECGHNDCYLLADNSVKCAVCYAALNNVTWSFKDVPDEEPEEEPEPLFD